MSNTDYTCTWNLKNGKTTFSKFLIYPVMIMWNNRIPSSRFIFTSCNWVTRKLLIIPRNIDIFMLHIFYVLNLMITFGKLGVLLVFVVIFISSMKQNNTSWAYFAKLTVLYSSFSWACMNLKIQVINNSFRIEYIFHFWAKNFFVSVIHTINKRCHVQVH